jgi:hypothetical protein
MWRLCSYQFNRSDVDLSTVRLCQQGPAQHADSTSSSEYRLHASSLCHASRGLTLRAPAYVLSVTVASIVLAASIKLSPPCSSRRLQTGVRVY